MAKLDAMGESFRREYQLEALRKIMTHAAREVPFWGKRMRECGFEPEGITSMDDIRKLPLLTKTEVQENLDQMVARGCSKLFLLKGYTSGTTGTPRKFYRDIGSVTFENAMLWHLRGKAGMEPGCGLIWLRGDVIAPAAQAAPPFWVRNYGENQLKVSTYHLIPKYREDLFRAMDAFRAEGAFAYPSAAYVLARWCREAGRKLPFKNLNTSSETVLAEQKAVIRSTLGGRWMDYYGQAERVNVFAALDDDEYREYSEYSVTELLPLGEDKHEVVGSTLHNYAMPLFRYRTGDVVSGRADDGENRPIIKGLTGRVEDFVVLPDGRALGRLDLIFKGLENIAAGQIYQKSKEHLQIRIVPDARYSQVDEDRLMHNARARMGDEIGVEIVHVHEIPRTKSGKFKFVISDVDIKVNGI